MAGQMNIVVVSDSNFSNMRPTFSSSCNILRSLLDFLYQHFFGFLKMEQILRVLWPSYTSCFLSSAEQKVIPVSVNYHFTRECNYKCGFCFHTSTSSVVLPVKVAERGLSMLKEAGMEKINFSGGEPFIHKRGRFLGQLVTFCKVDLRINSVSIVSNGSLIKKEWMEEYAEYLDILAISCDSFDRSTNDTIGRFQNDRTDHIGQLYRIRDWCEEYGVVFKINTVVNTYNVDEDMSAHLKALKPARWKVFQCLRIEGENAGPKALRNAQRFYVTDAEFETFLRRHSGIDSLVAENNALMKDSYLILDERMRFLDCRKGNKEPSKSILDIGVENALKFSGFDEKAFLDRGGFYEWSKSTKASRPTDISDW